MNNKSYNRVDAAQKIVYRLRQSNISDWQNYMPSEYNKWQYIICDCAIVELGKEDYIPVRLRNGDKGEFAFNQFEKMWTTKSENTIEFPDDESIEIMYETGEAVCWGKFMPCVSGKLLKDVSNLLIGEIRAYSCGKSNESLYLIDEHGNRAIIMGLDIPAEERHEKNW